MAKMDKKVVCKSLETDTHCRVAYLDLADNPNSV